MNKQNSRSTVQFAQVGTVQGSLDLIVSNQTILKKIVNAEYGLDPKFGRRDTITVLRLAKDPVIFTGVNGPTVKAKVDIVTSTHNMHLLLIKAGLGVSGSYNYTVTREVTCLWYLDKWPAIAEGVVASKLSGYIS